MTRRASLLFAFATIASNERNCAKEICDYFSVLSTFPFLAQLPTHDHRFSTRPPARAAPSRCHTDTSSSISSSDPRSAVFSIPSRPDFRKSRSFHLVSTSRDPVSPYQGYTSDVALTHAIHRSTWSSQVILNPSIHSHLQTPSLLPSTNSTDSKRSYITAYAPASAQHLATIPSASRDDISGKIGRAVEAQKGWRNSSWARRRRVLRTLLEFTVREMEALSKMASRDSGKTRERLLKIPLCVLRG